MTIEKVRIPTKEGGPNFVFTGALVGTASTTTNCQSQFYSGFANKSIELRLYHLADGTSMCLKITRWTDNGKKDHFCVRRCVSRSQIQDFFGMDSLALRLYWNAKMPVLRLVT